MKSFVFAVIAIAVFKTSRAEINCEDDIHVSCASRNLYEVLGENGKGVWSEEMLLTHCGHVIEDIECKQEYLATCDNSDSEQDFKLLTNNLKNTVIELCNESSDLRRDYRLHSPCLINSSTEFDGCALHSAQSSMKAANAGVDNGDETVQALCRFQEIFRRCVTEAVQEKCGPETSKFIKKLMAMPLEELIAAKCNLPTK